MLMPCCSRRGEVLGDARRAAPACRPRRRSPSSRPSAACSRPGRCAAARRPTGPSCRSSPGDTYLPVASISRAPAPGTSPIFAKRPSWMATSARIHGLPGAVEHAAVADHDVVGGVVERAHDWRGRRGGRADGRGDGNLCRRAAAGTDEDEECPPRQGGRAKEGAGPGRRWVHAHGRTPGWRRFFQMRYAGTPASTTASPTSARPGWVNRVLSTIAADAATKSTGVRG